MVHPEITPRGLRIEQAAAYLNVTPWFLATLLREGKLPFVLAGKRKIVDRHDLDNWLEAQKAAA